MFSFANPGNLTRFGFKLGKGGAHAARTLMLSEWRRLLEITPPTAGRADYRAAIVDENALDKPTVQARKLTYEHLRGLYALDAGVCLFRVVRGLWYTDQDAQPVLALQMALTRDALLRVSVPAILRAKPGEQVTREQTRLLLDGWSGGRLSAASLRSYAQNLNGTWTQAGFLRGKVKKIRCAPVLTPINVTFALFLAYLEGRLAQRLLSSAWVRVLDLPEERLIELTQAAAQRGLLVFRRTGGIMEVRFPDYLTAQEQEWISKQA